MGATTINKLNKIGNSILLPINLQQGLIIHGNFIVGAYSHNSKTVILYRSPLGAELEQHFKDYDIINKNEPNLSLQYWNDGLGDYMNV